MAMLWSCQPEGNTPTSGQIAVVTSESIAPLMRKEVEEFQRLYEKTQVTMTVASTREAIAQLLRGEVKTIFTPRLLNDEERQIAARYQVKVDTFRIAMDGIALVAAQRNPLKAITLAQLRAIYRGEKKQWQELGGAHMRILPLALSRNTATAEMLLHEVVQDSMFSNSTYVCSTSVQLLEIVSQREEALGFAGMAWLSQELRPHDSTFSRIKVLSLAENDNTEPVLLHQSTIYRNEYPLRRTLYCLSTDRSLGVAIGLVSFITSAQGQKLVLNAGLVPVTMPIKLVKFGREG